MCSSTYSFYPFADQQKTYGLWSSATGVSRITHLCMTDSLCSSSSPLLATENILHTGGPAPLLRLPSQCIVDLLGHPRGGLPASTSAWYCLTASSVLYQRLPRFTATRPCRTNQPR
jgi:hypothetical protein